MTERMENALNHIKTSVDVDPWAVEEVERVFKAYEQTQDGDLISKKILKHRLYTVLLDIKNGREIFGRCLEVINELPSVSQDAIPTSVLKDAKAEIVKEMNSVSDPSVFHGYYRAWEIICKHIWGVDNES